MTLTAVAPVAPVPIATAPQPTKMSTAVPKHSAKYLDIPWFIVASLSRSNS